MTVNELRSALAAKPTGADAESLAAKVRTWFGADTLKKGPGPKVDGLSVAWAIEITGVAAEPTVTTKLVDGNFPLQRIGSTDVFATVKTYENGSAFTWSYMSGRQRLGNGNLEVYDVHPDSLEHPGIPKGTLTQQPKWKSQIFAGTERDWWVYVPAQYKAEEPAAVMVFQDGAGAKNYVPTVFDNLIARGEMPVTVAICISPGTLDGGRSNRSFEYDTLTDQYARFILEEILPEVEKTVKLSHDREKRAIAGISSGGICAWTVAWERPNEFSKVLSWVGSFTGIAARLKDGKLTQYGGDTYPVLIRKTEKKPIRVFLQDGANDLDNNHGSWPLANQQMAKSLAFMGYDHNFVYGNGFHSDRHGRAILPDSLRWLWRKSD